MRLLQNSVLVSPSSVNSSVCLQSLLLFCMSLKFLTSIVSTAKLNSVPLFVVFVGLPVDKVQFLSGSFLFKDLLLSILEGLAAFSDLSRHASAPLCILGLKSSLLEGSFSVKTFSQIAL